MANLKEHDLAKKVMYASSQLYSVHLAELLKSNFNWEPVYFFTSAEHDKLVAEKFPESIRHNYYDAVKGIAPSELSNLKQEPIDPDLLEKLSSKEFIAMTMMDRNDSNSDSFKHRERAEFYYYLVRYWSNVISKLQLDIIVFEEEPHQVSDYVLYCICEHLGVDTILMVRTISDLGIIPMRRFEDGSELLLENYQSQIKAGNNKNIDEHLPEAISQYLNKLNGKYDDVLEDHLWDQVDTVRAQQGKVGAFSGFVSRFKKTARILLNMRNHITRLGLIVNSSFESDQKEAGKKIQNSQLGYFKFIQYKLRTIRIKKRNKSYYQSITKHSPDYSRPYILCALQYQPEKTTCPLGGRFVDQFLMIELLAGLLPEGWSLYVKEHPSQFVPDYTRYGEMSRSKEFYDRLNGVENAQWVPLADDVFSLIDGSQAVASIGGTICWEAIVRSKPALSFGYGWFRGCEGVFRIENSDDLEGALNLINGDYKVDNNLVKLFAKSIWDIGCRGTIGGDIQLEHKGVTANQNAEQHFNAIKLLLKFESDHKQALNKGDNL